MELPFDATGEVRFAARIDREAHRLVFNPGECAGHLAGHNAVGVVDLANLEVELLKF